MGEQTIFVSHTHADKAIADAISDVIRALFQERVRTRYSTAKELDRGIKKGEDWVRWIQNEVRGSRIALILLTPNSIQKPWVLWEAGAVEGAGLATDDRERRVLPIQFKLDSQDIPSPFARTQLTDGCSYADMDQFFGELVRDFAGELAGFDSYEAGRRISRELSAYLTKVEQALLRAPMTVTEPAVQQWLTRIDDLDRERRFSEIEQLHDWMNIAFGRDYEDRKRPLDPRLHLKIGGLYANAKRPVEAARELELARQLAPRDIFLLRHLGKAYLDQKDTKRAGEIMQAISELDSEAFSRNAETAALKARWQRETHDPGGAGATLESALARNPQSYYLADLAAQTALDSDDLEGARHGYRRVRDILAESGERSVWALASYLTAELAIGQKESVLQLASRLQQEQPRPDQLEAIWRGLEQVAHAFGKSSTLEAISVILVRGV